MRSHGWGPKPVRLWHSKERKKETCPLSIMWENSKINPLQARKRAITRTSAHQHPDLTSSTSRALKNKSIFCSSSQPSLAFCHSILMICGLVDIWIVPFHLLEVWPGIHHWSISYLFFPYLYDELMKQVMFISKGYVYIMSV